jgi:hypothetical protein
MEILLDDPTPMLVLYLGGPSRAKLYFDPRSPATYLRSFLADGLGTKVERGPHVE